MKTKVKHPALLLLFALTMSFLYSMNLFAAKEVTNYRSKLESFNSLYLSGNFIINIDESDMEEISIETDKNFIDQIVWYVSDQTLYIVQKTKISDRPVINLMFKQLKSIKTNGNIELNTIKNFITDTLDIYTDYDNEVNLYINATDLYLHSDGFGRMNISGDITTMTFESTEETENTISMRGSVFYANINGYSSVFVEGSLHTMNISIDNAAFFKASDVELFTARLYLKGSSEAIVNAIDSLEYSINDNSTLVIEGNTKYISKDLNDLAVMRKQ